ncbi:hypothetical protein ACOTDF_19495 [Achromobacter insuavis]|uniref:hypothetical protein n=1 Tax=Achromobacter insuavis TaxID=1287735 RepID=UPI003B9B98B7
MNENNAAQPVLTDEEINAACDWPGSNTTMRAENDRAMAREVEAAVLRKLSKLRAPVAGEAREHIEQRAVNRYRPVPDGKLSYKVVAGDGTRSLYTGTKDSCLRVAAKLTEAFLDGAFVASDAAPQASAEPAQPCSCPSGDGSLRHPCAVHQASEAVRDAGIAASEDVVLPPLPEALALQPGQLGHTDQTLDYFARAAVLADRQQRADRSQVARNECDCATCRPHSVEMRMILCSICGDKRCPHAADHRNACTATQPEQGERE